MDRVTDILRTADAIAQGRRSELSDSWIRFAHSLGSLIPLGSAVDVLQEVARLDLLIRAIEDEADALMHPLVPLSTTWIGLAYEVVRALKQRDVEVVGLKLLLVRLELVRMPLLKFEIAKDGKLPEPLKLYKYPAQSGPARLYNPKDRDKAIRPIIFLGAKGLAWVVPDAAKGESAWIARSDLADELLALVP